MFRCLAGIAWLSAVVWAADSGIISAVQQSFSSGSDARAMALLKSYHDARGVTPEYLEAMSWLARVELGSRNYPQAEALAQQVYTLSLDQMKQRPLDKEPHLSTALGASIEVASETLAATGRRSEAVTYLNQQAKTFAATSVSARIRKNLLLLTLEGKPAPALEGAILPKGKPALLFFWAHWCPDCKAEAPVLRQILSEFPALSLVAPTQHYGYVAGGVDASPASESAYIQQVRSKYYAALIPPSSPINEANFIRYGASTTPTIVLVDAAGIVRLYHPGALPYAELRQAVARVLK